MIRTPIAPSEGITNQQPHTDLFPYGGFVVSCSFWTDSILSGMFPFPI